MYKRQAQHHAKQSTQHREDHILPVDIGREFAVIEAQQDVYKRQALPTGSAVYAYTAMRWLEENC